MSAQTAIEWTDRTWNPVRGCSRVSAGCDNCYAMNMAHRFSGTGKPFEGLTTIRRGKVDWAGVARFIPEQLGAPLKWRKPSRVFVNSMSDLFHPSLSNEEIAAVFGVMAACPRHTFQVLTKQPKRAADWFEWANAAGLATDACLNAALVRSREPGSPLSRYVSGLVGTRARAALPWPLPNLHIGVSAENQKTADERIPLLLTLPAAVRFVSAEPLLESVDLSRWVRCSSYCGRNAAHDSGRPLDFRFLDWVIVGGESGSGARPCDVAWIKSLVQQCNEAQISCFVKQLGARPCITEAAWRNMSHGMMPLLSPRSEHPMVKTAGLVQLALSDRSGGDMSEWPEQLRVREFPRVP